MARNTVREAVRALAHNGLPAIRQGSGTYVVAASELAGVMHRRSADADPRHIAELRSTLESGAAEPAALRRTERDLKQLDALLAHREEAWVSGEAFVKADASLHMAVLAASHNDVMTTMYADLGEVLRDWLRDDIGEELTPRTYVDHAPFIVAHRRDPRGRRGGRRQGGGGLSVRVPAQGVRFWWLTHTERTSFQQRPVSRTVWAGPASTEEPSLSRSHQRSHSMCRRTRSAGT